MAFTENFKSLSSWTLDFKIRILRNFEFLGIPLLFRTGETIKSIGGVFGEVYDVSYKDNDFSKVEVNVVMNDNSPTYSSIPIRGNGKVISVQIKEVDVPLSSKGLSQKGVASHNVEISKPIDLIRNNETLGSVGIDNDGTHAI